MAIESDPMGGVVLTGEDAAAFARWMKEGEDAAPDPVVLAACRRGKEMMREFAATGKVSFTITCKTPPSPGEALVRMAADAADQPVK